MFVYFDKELLKSIVSPESHSLVRSMSLAHSYPGIQQPLEMLTADNQEDHGNSV